MIEDRYDIDRVKTPYDIEYTHRKDDCVERVKLEVPTKKVTDLLLEKVGRLTTGNTCFGISEELRKLVDTADSRDQLDRVAISLTNEENILWLVKVLYFWEEKQGVDWPTSLKEYKERLAQDKEDNFKDERENMEKEITEECIDFERFRECPFFNIGMAAMADEMPFGYELRYSDLTIGKMQKKRPKFKKAIMKTWNLTNFSKMLKKL
jgi:hypothetical protein